MRSRICRGLLGLRRRKDCRIRVEDLRGHGGLRLNFESGSDKSGWMIRLGTCRERFDNRRVLSANERPPPFSCHYVLHPPDLAAMPPKVVWIHFKSQVPRLTRDVQRKRVEDPAAEAAPRATRTSSRLKSTASGTSQTTPASVEKSQKFAKGKADDGVEVRSHRPYHERTVWLTRWAGCTDGQETEARDDEGEEREGCDAGGNLVRAHLFKSRVWTKSQTLTFSVF